MIKPFQQLPLDRLAEAPRLPHRWTDCATHEAWLHGPFARHRVRWRTFGQGPPLVLVHGLMTAGYSFRYLLQPLGAHYTLYIPDLPGAGDTEPVDGAYTIANLCDWLVAWLAAVGLERPPVIGNSLGGYLCLQLLYRHPSALERLVVLHAPGVPTPRMWVLRAALSAPGSRALLHALVRRDPERWVHRNVHYYDESLKSREETRIWAEPLRTPAGIDAFYRWLHDALNPWEMRRFEAMLAGQRDAAAPIPAPVALVYAATDPVVPPAVGDRLRALLPGASFTQLHGASHFAHVDSTDAFVEACTPFLRGA